MNPLLLLGLAGAGLFGFYQIKKAATNAAVQHRIQNQPMTTQQQQNNDLFNSNQLGGDISALGSALGKLFGGSSSGSTATQAGAAAVSQNIGSYNAGSAAWDAANSSDGGSGNTATDAANSLFGS